jgi:hypothetical protein
LAGGAGVAGEIFAGECGSGLGLRPTLRASGDAEGHICGRWPALIARQCPEVRNGEWHGEADSTCGVVKAEGSALLLGLVLQVEELRVERDGDGEGLAGVTVKTGEGVPSDIDMVIAWSWTFDPPRPRARSVPIPCFRPFFTSHQLIG